MDVAVGSGFRGLCYVMDIQGCWGCGFPYDIHVGGVSYQLWSNVHPSTDSPNVLLQLAEFSAY